MTHGYTRCMGRQRFGLFAWSVMTHGDLVRVAHWRNGRYRKAVGGRDGLSLAHTIRRLRALISKSFTESA